MAIHYSKLQRSNHLLQHGNDFFSRHILEGRPSAPSGFFFQASLAHLKPMEKIEVMATITAIDQPDSGKKDFAVILNCGQAFKDVLSYKWIPP